MKFSAVLTVIILALITAPAVLMPQVLANAERVKFPANFRDGVHYATVNRGNIREELFVSREAIAAAKRGEPFPSGTVITMEDHRNGRLHRYVVMEKRQGWNQLTPEAQRAGDWLFREFKPDRSPNTSEDGLRCMVCHQSQAANDFVFTVPQMKRTK